MMSTATLAKITREYGTIPNLLTITRLLLVPVLWILALQGHAFYAGIGLILAGLTDTLDGFIARRYNLTSAVGSQLDSLADNAITLSAFAWLVMLRPEIFAGHPVLWLVTLGFCLTDIVAGLLKFGRVSDLHLYSSKAASVILYCFIVHTLLFPGYSSTFLYIGAASMILCCSEDMAILLTHPNPKEGIGSIVRVWLGK
jgi:phosphatidylglycerophosphate synthase